MSPYKGIVLFFKGLLAVVTLIIAAILIGPVIKHSNQQVVDKSAIFETSEAIDGLEWIIEHGKYNLVADHNPDLIFTDREEDFDEMLMASIHDNVFAGEMLFSQFGGDKSKHLFLENLIEAKYMNYVGKTFKDLSDPDEVPVKIIENYEKTAGSQWAFYGEGIVIANDETVLVLLEGEDYTGDVTLVSDEGNYPYNGYFELVEIADSTHDYFKIPANDSGIEKLSALGLGDMSSAKLRVSNRLYSGYYYAGAFCGISVNVPTSYSAMPDIMASKGIYDESLNESLFWKWYYHEMRHLLSEKHDISQYDENDGTDENRFFIDGQTIYIRNGNASKEFFMKGVNLGAALPGKTFTEFPQEKETYYKWLEQMETLNINTLRVYTLLPPVFYEALHDFNQGKAHPIYLLQEIWPEEYPEDHNYLGEAYNEAYRQEIEYMVHAIHGNINIPNRAFRAYGLYKHDVSQYLIGYLVGREMEPEEVMATDELNEGYAFKGRYLYSVSGATPTEAWLASACDYALRIEDMFYSDSPLTAIVSWPTLDPKRHDSEWHPTADKSKVYNDSAVVDINNIGINPDTVSGFFGAYHIYPNYPDFMNNELAYDSYTDDQGRFRYGGYLQEFMSGHGKYPAVVAEYGISTSQVTAHYSPDGYHHGGLSEEMQASGIIRMTDAIIREGYSGAIIFEWMDEWAKKTWTTEPYMIPYDRHQVWHNVLDPEQNYGILAIESTKPEFTGNELFEMGQNEGYIYLRLDPDLWSEGESTLQIAINTIPEDKAIDEFLLEIGSVSSLKPNPGYNWISGNYRAVEAEYSEYEDMTQIINKENMSMYGDITPERSINLSLMKYGSFDNPVNSVMFDGAKWHVRIPYGLLGVSDPSQNSALYDEEKKIPVLRDQIGTKEIERVEFTILSNGKSYSLELGTWDQPEYSTRLKGSFDALSEYFGGIE